MEGEEEGVGCKSKGKREGKEERPWKKVTWREEEEEEGKANQPAAINRVGKDQEEPGLGMLPLSLTPDSERKEISNCCARMFKREYQAMYIYVQIFQVRNNYFKL